MYLPLEAEAMAADDAPLRDLQMDAICQRCGWARRYHAGVHGTGPLIPSRRLCSAFQSAHVVERQKIVAPQRIIVIPPLRKAA